MKCFLSSLCAILILTTSVQAKSPVWKVSKGDDYLYLGGTIHVLSKNDYPLPAGFDKAYQLSDDIMLETNEAALQAPELQAKFLGVMTFQDHQSLSTVLNPEVYDEFSALLKSKGIPIAVFEKFTPSGAMLALTGIELQKLGLMDGSGVDAHFAQRANADKKDTLFLETIDEQLGFIDAMNDLDPNKVIKSGVRDISNFDTIWKDLLNAWRSGDLVELEKLGIDDMLRDFPSLYQTLLVQRNKDWFGDLTRLIKTKDIEFILVGALHMAGDEGLISMLKKAGYDVEQLD